MTKVCPQRIIQEAIDLLESLPTQDDPGDEERIVNNVHELKGLSKSLHSMGIINVVEAA